MYKLMYKLMILCYHYTSSTTSGRKRWLEVAVALHHIGGYSPVIKTIRNAKNFIYHLFPLRH